MLPVWSRDVPHSRPATAPPRNDATMPVMAIQMTVVSDAVVADGLSPPSIGLTVVSPMPMPSRFSSNCTTSAITTPARMAPQEIWLRIMVRASLGWTSMRSTRGRSTGVDVL